MQNKKILIVEDEAPLLQVLKEELERLKFEVLEAQNGEMGLKVALECKPDLILLDVVMPVMDGMTMLRKLREDEWGTKAKVVLLTNLSDSEKMEEALKRGVYDYLIKTNWKIKDLSNLVKNIVN